MQITQGLFDHMVVQRNKQNKSDADFSGSCSGPGTVLACVRKNGKALKGFSTKRVGSATKRSFTGTLKGVPAGGPYTVELIVADKQNNVLDSCKIKDLLVGDVWIVAGQSNMQGCGLQSQRAKSKKLVRGFYLDDRWGVARDPLHNMHAAIDAVHQELCGGVLPPKNEYTGTGPAVAFGKSMLERTGVPQGLLACAHGGTSMAQWNPSLKKLGGDSLYGAACRRLKKNGGKVAGIIWYQGESDANDDAAPNYTKAMKKLVSAFRRDCKNKSLPIAIVQISRVVGWPEETAKPWNSVQDQERLLQGAIKHLAAVPAIDLPLTDAIHIEGVGQNRLGLRLAQAMAVLRGDKKAGKMPIELGKIELDQEGRGMGRVTVHFDNVMGKLEAGSRPVGFSFGSEMCRVVDTRLEKNKAIVLANVSKTIVEEQVLFYGFGTDPVCNITDSADRSLPVFQARLGNARAKTGFCRSYDLALLKSPFVELVRRAPNGLAWHHVALTTDFADVREEFDAWPQDDICMVFRTRFQCNEKMRLAVLLGYDGPIAVWIDGKRKMHDATGTNPATPDTELVKLTATRGKHEIIIALGSQKGKAWGIFLRLARTDITPKRAATDHPNWEMPIWG